MFYIGMHEGTINDNYISSSRWFNGEYQYRTKDFKRKIIKTFKDRKSARKEEARFLRMIKEIEFGKKYYNLKNGRPSGGEPWNKGKKNIYSLETLGKMSAAKRGNTFTKNKSMPCAALNGKKSAKKQSQTVTGRKRKYSIDGSWKWEYPLKNDG